MNTNVAQIKAFLSIWKWYVVSAGAVILIVGGFFWSTFGSNAATGDTEIKPEVRVGRVLDLMSGGASLSGVAEIRSVSEAKITTESGGRVTRVRASLGDFVAAGQILAEMDNGSERAALLQAEGALESVKATFPNTNVSLESAKSGAVNTLLSAYAVAESATHDAIDETFLNPDTNNLKFLVLSSNAAGKNTLENNRPQLTSIMKREALLTTTLSKTTDLQTELAKTEIELRTVRAFLDTLIIVLNAGIPSPSMSQATITDYLTDASAARAAITASLASIASAESVLDVASNNSGDSGAPSISSASVKQAQGAYNAALASLEKTIIRSPLPGTLNNFTIKLGDFLSPMQQVAVVSNNGALEAFTYVTEEDMMRVFVGQKVTLEEVVGTITRIAPALDPITRRVEVRIGLPQAAKAKLTSGQSVHIELAKNTTTTLSKNSPLAIPITALKIETARTIVFSVENNILVAKEIKIGKLSGDSVQVSEGLTTDTEIVIDARGLKEGDEVTVIRN